MATFEQHCRDCMALLGDRHENVNRWVDELFRKHGANHRKHRHHWRGVWEAKKLFGPEGAKAVVVHIVRDCGAVPTARSYEKTNLGILIAPAFLLSPATDLKSEEEFKAAATKALKKGRRDGIFELQAGSSVVEGSIPSPPTNFGGSMVDPKDLIPMQELPPPISLVAYLDNLYDQAEEPQEEIDFGGMNGVCCK